MAKSKSVLVAWKEGDDDGAVVFNDDGAEKALDKARSYVAVELNRYGVTDVTISDVTTDDEGHVTTSGKAKAAE
jgi:hypothetical protein